MKKVLKLFILIALIFTFNVKADKNDVTVYLFRGHGCSHCYDALEYFYKNRKKADYNVVVYEVWENEDNFNFLESLKESIGDDSTGVPYIVIGNNYHKSGFGDLMVKDLENAILEAQKDSNYKDIVKENLSLNTKVVSEDLLTSAHKEYVYFSFSDYLITFLITAFVCFIFYLIYKKIKNRKKCQNN